MPPRYLDAPTRTAAPHHGLPATAHPQRPHPALTTVLADMAEYRRHARQQELVWQQLERRLAAAQS